MPFGAVIEALHRVLPWRGLAQREPQPLSILQRRGSVEHYFHFLLGFFVPLQLHALGAGRGRRFILRSCGPLDAILHATFPGRLVIEDKTSFAATLARAGEGGSVVLEGLDDPPYFRRRAFQTCVKGFARTHKHALDRARARFADYFEGSERVLLIERGRADPYYDSEHAESRGAGKARRHIPNQAELADFLRERYGACCNVVLEELDIFEQAALFMGARRVCGQHGAAFANLLWCRPGTEVIELMTPPDHAKQALLVPHFAEVMGLVYRVAHQPGMHTPVDLGALAAVLDGPPNPPALPLVGELKKKARKAEKRRRRRQAA